MITVTDEMINVAARFFHPPPFPPNVRAGLEAVMALIDPVPNDVTTMVTLDNEELTRVMAGGPSPEQRVGTDVWRHECGCCYSTFAELLADGAIEPNA